MEKLHGSWNGIHHIDSCQYICGFCSKEVGADKGYMGLQPGRPRPFFISICPSCNRPSFFEEGKWTPGPRAGRAINHLPADIAETYEQARLSVTAGAYSGAILLCRKILSHVAVDKEASKKSSFAECVDYLVDKNYVPPHGKEWVDEIRKVANIDTHELKMHVKDDADMVLTFTANLLQFAYEFPALLPKKPKEVSG